MTLKPELPPGAWVVRLETTRPEWQVEIRSAAKACDHVTATTGAVSVLVGGLVHNRVELTQLLGSDRVPNDASLVLAAYARWGEAAIERVQGSCAIVICDLDRRMLIAARDRLGTYPLFSSEPSGALIASNSIDALLRQPGVSGAIDLPVIVDHVRHVWPFADETYFAAVRRVPPGNFSTHDAHGPHLRRYWDPTPQGPADWVQPADLGEFDALFEQAVRRCQAPGPAGIFLSGGLDSVSVAAVAAATAQASRHPAPWALSLVFPHPESDEEDVQRAVARELCLPQIMLGWDQAVGPSGLLREALNLSASAPAPLLNLWMPAYDRLATASRERGCVTILTGAGGDEWLTVSPFYAADLIRRFDLVGLVQLYRGHLRSNKMSMVRYLRNIVWGFGVRPLALAAAMQGLDAVAPSLLHRAALRRLDGVVQPWLAPDPTLRRTMADRELRRRDTQLRSLKLSRQTDRHYPRAYVAEMRSGLEHPLVSMELEELYAHGRRIGMHMLQPFWDAQLVEFLYRTPPELLNEGGRSKSLVRHSVARRFPELGFDTQRKLEATSFFRSLIEREGSKAWSDLGGIHALAEVGVVDRVALNTMIAQTLRTRDSRHYYSVWDLLSLDQFVSARRE